MKITDIDLRLSGQRALWGAITGGLRAVSIEFNGKKILWRCIFQSERAKTDEWEKLSAAAAEIISDFPDVDIEEQYIVTINAEEMMHLRNLLFLRHE